MDKVSISSLGAIAESEYSYIDYNGASIAVRRSAPTVDLMAAIQWGINVLVDDRPFISTPIQSIVEDFCVLKAFTNVDVEGIDFTDTLSVYAAYDVVKPLLSKVYTFFDVTKVSFLLNGLRGATENIVKYRNSAAGILQSMTENGSDQMDKLNDMLNQLKQSENSPELKQFMEVYEKVGTVEVPAN